MADYFTLVEIIKLFVFTKTELMYHAPFTYQVKTTTGDLSSSYFISIYNAIDVTNKEYLNIRSFVVNLIFNYSQKLTLNDCLATEESFYFDIQNQVLYIHFNHEINPYANFSEYGKTLGYTNDTVREFHNIVYTPDLISVPNLKKKVDPLQYNKMAFFGGNIVLNNSPVDASEDGQFDNIDPLYGNDTNVLFGVEGDLYSELLQITKNYIENYDIDFEKATFRTKDKREQLSKKIPIAKFTVADYPDLGDDKINKIKPDGYGTLTGVPGICINEENAGNKEFYFASLITSITVYAKKDNKWETVIPISIDYNNGTVELSDADAHIDGDDTKGLLNIKADGLFVNISNPGDIIVDMNYLYLNINYDSSNYNITEWENEKQYLEDVGLYLDEEKDIFSWIELLQNGSTVGFQYMDEYGIRTMRLDNPNRTPVIDIEAIEILNNANIPTDYNADLFATHAVVFFNKDYTDDFFERVENRDYYNQVFQEHRKEFQFEIESLLNDQTGAENKAVIIMEDQSIVRPIWPIIIHGKDFYSLRIFDIINVELSYPGEKIGEETNDTIRFTKDAPDTIRFTKNTGIDLIKFVNYNKIDIIINRREYFGDQRCQIIGIDLYFDNGDVKLTVRQRAYSQEFANITGYIPEEET